MNEPRNPVVSAGSVHGCETFDTDFGKSCGRFARHYQAQAATVYLLIKAGTAGAKTLACLPRQQFCARRGAPCAPNTQPVASGN